MGHLFFWELNNDVQKCLRKGLINTTNRTYVGPYQLYFMFFLESNDDVSHVNLDWGLNGQHCVRQGKKNDQHCSMPRSGLDFLNLG